MNPELYLGHPFDIRKQVRNWELNIERDLKLKLVNPFYDIHREDVLRIDRGETGKYESLDYKTIVDKDIGEIKRTQGGIYVLEDPKKAFSIGTIQEIVYAFAIFNKPVYTLVLNGNAEHPWIKYHSSEILTSWQALDEFLVSKFKLRGVEK